jgi:hypothetical protein
MEKSRVAPLLAHMAHSVIVPAPELLSEPRISGNRVRYLQESHPLLIGLVNQ